MADQKISELTALTGANLADVDAFAVVDTSAVQTKKITYAELKTALDTGTGFVRITGDTMTGNLSFGDNNKIILGGGSDLQIYHDGLNSYVNDQGTGDLILRASSSVKLQSASGVVEFLSTNSGTGALTLASTSFTGSIDVTGTVTADGLTVDAANSTFNGAVGITSAAGAGISEGLLIDYSTNLARFLTYDSTTGSEIAMYTQPSGGSTVQRLRINSGGDISFYEDTGTTPKFFWDASTERLGIGTSSPSSALHVINSNATGEGIATFEAASAKNGYVYINADANRRKSLVFQSAGVDKFSMGVGDTDELSQSSFFIGNGKTGGSGAKLVIDSTGNVGIGITSPEGITSGITTLSISDLGSKTTGDKNGVLAFKTNDASYTGTYSDGVTGEIYSISESATGAAYGLGFLTGTINSTDRAERMRIDSSGNVGIGTTSIANEADHKKLKISGGSGTGAGIIEFADTSNNIDGAIFADGGNLFIVADRDNATADSSIRFRVDGSSEKMRIDSSGRVGIGGVANANWRNDATDTVLQLGTEATLHSDGNVTTELWNNAYVNNSDQYKNISTRGASRYMQYEGNHRFFTAASASAGSTISMGERMRIDSSGNLLVGTTQVGVASSSTVQGIQIAPTTLSVARSGGQVAFFNRQTNDGAIVDFRKDGSTVGIIGTTASQMYIGYSDTGIRFTATADDIRPWNPSTGVIRDGAIDLGDSAGRFKDLYLSGGVVFGATGGSVTGKTLDEYEEGTFTPTFVGSTGGTVTLAAAFDKYAYTKVGRVVTITGRVDVSGTPSLSGNLLLQGLPFSSGDLSDSAGYTVQYGFITIGSSNTGNPIVVELQENVTEATLRLEDWSSASGVLTNNSRIQMSITYFTS